MSSKWLWNSINLWVSDQDIARDIKRAELFVLDSTSSVFHFFGTGSRKYPTKGLVIGDVDKDSLDTDATSNTSRTLTTPWGVIADLRINSIKFANKKYAGATVDGISYTSDVTPIYDFEIEFVVAA
jgi:hypothetical protein